MTNQEKALKAERYKKWYSVPENRIRKQEKSKEWQKNNAEKIREKAKEYKSRPENIARATILKNEWRKNNPEKHKQYNLISYKRRVESGYKQNYDKSYRENPANKAKRNARCSERFKDDLQYKISVSLRAKLYVFLKKDGKVRQGLMSKIIGCTKTELKDFIASKFDQDMNWGNYGKWHIDHIIPLSSFDLTNNDQVLEAFHFSNLQPLWAIDNMKKGKSIPAL
jgi:hypothetical protein